MTRAHGILLPVLVSVCLLVAPRTSAADQQSCCVGDCNLDGVVTVDEVLAATNGSLDSDLLLCPAADRDTNFIITVDEVLTAVDDALNDCHFTANPSACRLPGN